MLGAQIKKPSSEHLHTKGKVAKNKTHAKKPGLISRAKNEAIKTGARRLGLLAWLAGPVMKHVGKWKPD
eukprot:9922627-Heterocapsa_arctica.AAC.1